MMFTGEDLAHDLISDEPDQLDRAIASDSLDKLGHILVDSERLLSHQSWYILRAIALGEKSIDEVAKMEGMSRRDVQRQFAKARELAKRHLAKKG